MKLEIGDRAPNFTLRNTEREKISLMDFQGKNVVLLFFPLAFTSVCTEELCSVRDRILDYTGLNAEIVAISVDSIATLKKFKEDQGYSFTLLSDFNKEVSRAYGSLYEDYFYEMKGVSKRSAFLIDREGVIRYAEVLDNALDIPNFAQLDKTLLSLSQSVPNE